MLLANVFSTVSAEIHSLKNTLRTLLLTSAVNQPESGNQLLMHVHRWQVYILLSGGLEPARTKYEKHSGHLYVTLYFGDT